MRKQKIIKMTASPLDPSLEGSFQPPATHNGDISIVFRGSDMSIHGWDGSAWSTIYTRNANDKQFTFPHTYENYYVKSLTGSEETFSASFFSTDKYQGSTPLLAGIQRGTKLHDIEEVPIYTASDVNKLLTIMSDGSLRWLGISESYIVEVIGSGGEETPSEESSSVSAGNIVGLEEHADLTLHGNAQLIDGVLHVDGTSGTYASLPHSLDYERENGDLTVSMWIKPNSLPSNWNGGLVSKMGAGWSGWITAVSTMDADGPTGNMTQGGLQTSFFGGGNANNRYYPENGMALNEWQHVAFVMVAVGEYKMYHNGVEILSYNPTNRPQSTTGALRFGGWGPFNGYQGFFDGQIDGIKIEKVAKTAEEILNEFNSGSSTPAPAGPTGEGTFLEELSVVATNLTSGADITNGIFNRTTTTTSGNAGTSYISLKDDNIIAYDESTGETVNREFTVSFWAKPEIIGSGYVLGLYGPTTPSEPDRGCAIRFYDNGNKITFNLIGLDEWTNKFKTDVCSSNEWIGEDTWKHFALVYKDNGAGSYITTLYVDGVPGATKTSSIRLFPKYTDKQKFGIGKTKVDDMNGFANSHYRGSLDSIQIGDGVALTDEQVASIAAQTDRQMSIETAQL